jgi:hydroxyethylthiazole kinase-like uncharacterized protein yjeF
MDEDAVHQLVPDLLRRLKQRLVVLDALAMEVATRDAPAIQDLGGQVILTPHAGEMASMLHIPKEQVLRDPSAITLVAAEQFRAIVALKGSQTYIGTPEGILYCFRSGTIGLATAGSGDTLAGIIAGIAARGATPAQAAVWGVYLHGTAGNTLAARIGPLGFLAREVLAEVPHTMATVDRQNTPL